MWKIQLLEILPKAKKMKEWFAKMLSEEMEKRGLNKLELAQFLELPPSSVHRWLEGSSPSIDHVYNILAKLGGDLDRASPSHDPLDDLIGSKEGDDAELLERLKNERDHLEYLLKKCKDENILNCDRATSSKGLLITGIVLLLLSFLVLIVSIFKPNQAFIPILDISPYIIFISGVFMILTHKILQGIRFLTKVQIAKMENDEDT